MGRFIAGLLVAVVTAALPSTAIAAKPRPFGHPCEPQHGVLFCPTRTLGERVPSFDRTPLDVDVTLPLGTQAGDRLPTIVMMHGYGGSKSDFEQSRPEGDDPVTETLYHWNNNYFAKRGYAVVNYSARGFGRSCGEEEGSKTTARCRPPRRSYVHLADHRWEARDTQHLLGKLVDQGVTQPRRIGVTGISYGGGQSLELAYLRDRIRRRDGSFAAWKSPDGRRLEIAAAFPRWLWSDLVYSLLPNGRFLDFRRPSEGESRRPLGVPKQSYIEGLYALGNSSGTYCGEFPQVYASPFFACDDFSANLTLHKTRVEAGEPPDDLARRIANQVFNFHQGYGLSGTPAPLLLQDGWTDDLFPVAESLRIYNDLRARNPEAPVALQFGDLGHPRASNKRNSDRYFNDQGARFFDARLRGGSSGLDPGEVTTFTQTCPTGAPAEGPFRARSWAALHPGAIRFSGPKSQHVTRGNTDPYGAQFDPLAGTAPGPIVTDGTGACKTVPRHRAAGTAVYLGPPSRGYTMMGLPTVRADIESRGDWGQLDSRLWDVFPDGRQRLISRGAYRLRPNQSGEVVFQLFGNGYRFAPGHRPKLELLSKDEPFLRPSNNQPHDVEVRSARVALPTLEASPESGDDRQRACTERGTSGSDVIRGTPGDDAICAGAGNDTVYGGGGNDTIYGGGGNDTLRGEGGNDRVSGNAGDDIVRGGPGDDRLSGGDGDDQVIGEDGADRLFGGPGRDTLSGQDGRDYLNTRDNRGGNDIANGGSGDDACDTDGGDTRTSC